MNKRNTFIAGKIVGDAIQQSLPSSFVENYPPFMWPEECYAGTLMMDCEGTYFAAFSSIPSVPACWERIYGK